MKCSQKLCILLACHGLCGCANFGLGEELLSSPLHLRPVDGGFVATQRAGVDGLANDPTWETMRRQSLAAAVRAAGYCPKGIENLERKATPVRSIAIGTSRDLVYTGRCKQEEPPTGPAAVQPRVL